MRDIPLLLNSLLNPDMVGVDSAQNGTTEQVEKIVKTLNDGKITATNVGMSRFCRKISRHPVGLFLLLRWKYRYICLLCLFLGDACSFI
jgi:hypothetical protein